MLKGGKGQADEVASMEVQAANAFRERVHSSDTPFSHGESLQPPLSMIGASNS
jgi:hypothetical protein